MESYLRNCLGVWVYVPVHLSSLPVRCLNVQCGYDRRCPIVETMTLRSCLEGYVMICEDNVMIEAFEYNNIVSYLISNGKVKVINCFFRGFGTG